MDGERLSLRGPGLALCSAVLFGLSAPAAKLLVGQLDPWLLAGLLYLGSGVGLGVLHLVRQAGDVVSREARLTREHLPWLAGAIVTGGVLGPVMLMFALAGGAASTVALLLNVEGVFTALLAAMLFREHVPPRVAAGMAVIAAGAATLAWDPRGSFALGMPALLVLGACLAWAVDNNLTRAVSAVDPLTIAALKGLVAGAVNVGVALAQGAAWPSGRIVLAAAVVGCVGYGASLVLFVLALRALGTSRTGAYFSTAPFLGAVAAVGWLREPLTLGLAAGGVLMAIGVWLHVTERHAHEHTHPSGLTHRHAHYPDLDHRHGH